MASSSTTAFQEIAPSTSGTSSTLIRKPSFDVFINHRGPDVKETLASTIYKILREMKVTAFLDSEELEYGDFLTTTIEAAIRGATLHIAIFSERYAESPWCLAELSLMLKSGAKIIPVFYHVEPTDVRYVAQMKGKYADAFEKHKQKRRYSPEKLKEWKDALHKVSFYTGEIIKNNDDETRLLKNIVNIVLKEIRNVPLEVAKHPVGLEVAVKDFENTLQPAEGDQGVEVVGIWGMGGSGKTTLAKELYNQRSSSMQKSSFIFDIRDAKDMLHNKQNQLLRDFGVTETSHNVNQGKVILARHLRSFRVLIVMDDVSDADQLDALVPAKDSLPRGSLIIVTTRERQVLTSWHISSVYKMRALDSHHAEQLFCWHAFLQPSPLDGFEKLVKNFLEACDGLPLSLKVFGSQLYGNFCKPYWESMHPKISGILDHDIKKILEVSYNALDDEEKEAFLDTACFFIGKENSVAIEVWNGSGWSGLYTWERLLNKCLVELHDDNSIRMHDHLRDLGWEIASKQLPYRLWLPQQIINFDQQTQKRNRSLPTSLGDLSSLKHLHINYCKNLESLPTSLENLSSLTYLRIDKCLELKSLPTSLKNLSCLTNLLECLIISFCPIRQEDFEAGYLSFAFSNLKQMTLEGTEVCRISISEGRYQRLESLKLDSNDHLTEIEALPVNLACLDICDCPKLDKLPSFARFTSLRKFELKGCDLIEKVEGLQDCTSLEELNLQTCWEVPGIESLEQMGKLRKVQLRANKGSAIESCIQSIKNLPDEIIIHAQTVPDASSLVDSFKHGLPPELFVVDSSNDEIISELELQSPIGSPIGSAIMLCFVVHSLSTKYCSLKLSSGSKWSYLEIGEGKWALIGVFTQHSTWHGRSDFFKLADRSYGSKVKVERGLAVRGEKKRLLEVLLPLCKSLSG